MSLQRFYTLMVCLAGCSGALSGASGRELVLEFGAAGSADFADLANEVSLEQTVYSVGASHFVRGREGQFAVEGSLTWVDVNWSGNPLDGETGALYERGERASLAALWTRRSSAALGYSVFAGVASSRGRDGIFRAVGFTEALGFNLGATINYRLASEVVLGVGFLHSPAIVGSDREWLPILQVYWPINDHWTLQTRNGVVLAWRKDAAESRSFAFSALWNSEEWHLGKLDGRAYSIENEGLSLGVRFGWKFRSIRIEPAVQYTVAGQSTIWNKDRRVMESDLDGFLSADVKVSYAF